MTKKDILEERFIFNINEENGVINLIGKAINGGKISNIDIDLISNYSKATKIKITGLYQDTFEYFINKYGSQFKEIYFFKCPKIQDLKPLEKLKNIECIEFYWNQKAEKLWDLKCNNKLSTLALNDFNKITSLEPLSRSASIEKLEFGFFIHPKFKIESLEPLTRMKALKHLSFNAKKVHKDDFVYLGHLPNIIELNIPIKMFKTIEFAWIKAHLNKKAKGNFTATVFSGEFIDEENEKVLDTFVVGKRKPWLDSKIDKERIKNYTNKFNEMVKWFELNLDKMPNAYK